MKLFKKIQNTLLIIVFSISSLALFAGETDDAKSNLNKIQKQINSIDKQIKKNSKVKKGLDRSLKNMRKKLVPQRKKFLR